MLRKRIPAGGSSLSRLLFMAPLLQVDAPKNFGVTRGITEQWAKNLKKVLTSKKEYDNIIKLSDEGRRVGVDDDEGPPVPIPNTEVKLIGADDTWLATAWKNREMPTQGKPSVWMVFCF